MASFLTFDFLFCALAVLAGACVQGASGIGFALFAAPIVALRLPELVPGPMIVLGGAVSLLAALREYRQIDLRTTGLALAGRVPGSITAGLAVGLLPRSAFAGIFAAMILAAVALSLVGWRVRANVPALLTAGFASGFMGTMTSVGTPPMAIVLQHAEPARLRATVGGFLVVGALISVAVLAVAGRFGTRDLELSVGLLAPLALGFALSSHLIRRLDPRRVRQTALAICAVSAIALLVRHG
ncbi:MAG TPA: sulfite exporter TauE/SafE family protein [Burkholderiales bacterium]|nr:sulfite exporter TauE/SafE family protein [Burkholderiales bacterium]